MNTLHIFKPGKHTAMGGEQLDFGEADLRATAAAYDPAKHEAPLVVGHPRHDDPAYGWVESLGYAADGLSAQPHQVETAFAEAVKAGRYKKISASFYPPNHPSNPVPGVYYLRHVGFLGAQPPAVKGLKAVNFAAEDDGVVTVEFGDWGTMQSAGLWRRLREWIIGKFGLDEADQVLPGYAVEDVEREAWRPKPIEDEPVNPMFGEEPRKESHVTPEQIAAKEVELKQRAAAFAEREEKLKQQEANLADKASKTRRAEIVAFCEDLVKQGKLLPTQQAFAVEFMCGLPEDQVLEFGEGDQQQKTTSLAGFKGFLESMPNLIEFGEIAGRDKDTPPPKVGAAEFGGQVDEERLALHNKALAYAEQHQVGYAAAVAAVVQDKQ